MAIDAVMIAPVEVPAIILSSGRLMRGTPPSSSSSAISARDTINPLMPPPSIARAACLRRGFIFMIALPVLSSELYDKDSLVPSNRLSIVFQQFNQSFASRFCEVLRSARRLHVDAPAKHHTFGAPK